jgi:hypothetical protein
MSNGTSSPCSTSTPTTSSSSRLIATTRPARLRQGKEVFKGIFQHCAAAGVRATVANGVASDGRAAATVTCEFPGGRKVTANSVFELENGRITRELNIAAGDAKGA